MSKLIRFLPIVCTFVIVSYAFGQTDSFTPIPLYENAEQTSSCSIEFLSYPKYYYNEEGDLTPVVTDLVSSNDPDWDYEVTTGIWSLRVRNDGTYQASHKGDTFTYRLADLGIGRGDAFRSLGLGSPNWGAYQVIGDTIRWSDVFPNIDFSIRYINDILKVDVILRASYVDQLRAGVFAGVLAEDAFLTARFEIPEVFITSEARQEGQSRDLYAEPIDTNQTLRFVRDGEVVCSLRPVEAYPLDENGDPIESIDESPQIRTAQYWKLNENAPGTAEISAHLGDLANAPYGDIAIDPSHSFFSNNYTEDSLLNENSPTTNYGSATSFTFDNDDDRLIFGFIVNIVISSATIINAATLRLYMNDSNLTSDAEARAFSVTENWYESYVTYNNRLSGTSWSTAGGSFDEPMTPPVVLPANQDNIYIDFDVTNAMTIQLASGTSYVRDRGFIITSDDLPLYKFFQIRSCEYGTVLQRPRLTVIYDSPLFGAHNAFTSVALDTNLERQKKDHLHCIRYFAHDYYSGYIDTIVDSSYDQGLKVVPCFVAGASTCWMHCLEEGSYDTGNNVPDADEYASFVMYRLNRVSDYIDGTISNTITDVELGNEEAGESLWGNTSTPSNAYNAGGNFALYYLEARDRIKSEWPYLKIHSGGSNADHKTLSYPDGDVPGIGKYDRAFYCGFIDTVRSESGGSLHRLPEVISIHGSMYCPPEDLHQTNGSRKTWLQRIDDIFDTCNRGGYRPDFSITEYAFLKNEDFTETSQAIFYLRRVLMDATMLTEIERRPWHSSIYFSHPYSSWCPALCMYQSDDVERKICKVAELLFKGGSGKPGLNLAGYSCWIPAGFEEEENYERYEQDVLGYWNLEDGTIRCGWINANGEKWGAIWRFDSHTDEYEVFPNSENRNFYAPGNTSYLNANIYQFNFSSSPVTLDYQTQVPGNYDSNKGKTIYIIPNVNVNPMIIRFN